MTSVTHIVSEKIILKINENLPNMLTICLNSDHTIQNTNLHIITVQKELAARERILGLYYYYIGLHCYGSLRMESLFTIAQTMSEVVIILNLHVL